LAVHSALTELEGLEGLELGGDEEFADEGGFCGAAAEGFFGADASDIGIVIFLGDVSENEVAGAAVETFGIGKIFAYGVV
jgi:hypothetical protein